MSNNIIFRLFQEKDLNEVVEINKSSLPENYAAYFFMEIFFKFPEGFWVAEDTENNKIIGYCMWRVEKIFSNFSVSLRRLKIAHLISIAVIESYRRQKIGEQLFLNGMKAMRIHHQVQEYYLEVRVSNEPAIRLYEKNQFKRIKVIDSYYKDGENAFLLALKA